MGLIDKSVLIAELNKRINEYNTPIDRLGSNNIRLHECKDLLSFLDTLEVKEVDLEDELLNFIEKQKAWVKENRVVEYDNGDSFNHIYDLEPLARYFYELGLKAQKEGFKKESEINCPNFDEAQGTPITK